MGDFSFEESVFKHVSPKCDVHTFDPGAYGAKAPAGVSYHAWAIGDVPPQKSMGAILGLLGHAGKVIDILKVDCEGCEWEFFKKLFDSGVEIRQIILELHWGSSFPSN